MGMMSGEEISQKLVFFYECDDCGHQEVELMGKSNVFGLQSLKCPECGGVMSRIF